MKKQITGRPLHVKLKTAKKRTVSSQKWLSRQLNDPYVQQSKIDGYRSRAAYKLKEIDDKFKVLKPGYTVIDLGAAPGGWTQISLERVGSKGQVIGIDLTPMEPIGSSILICGDFCDPENIDEIKAHVKGPSMWS